MWARVTRGQIDPAKVDEGTQLSQAVAEAVKKQPGCQSFMNLGDRSTGRSVAISIWDTEEHARFSAADVLGDIVPKLQGLGARIEQPEFYEVIVS
jgi:quinol monooxygenase YgiN